MSTADGVGRWDPGALGRLETAVGGRSHVIARPQRTRTNIFKVWKFWVDFGNLQSLTENHLSFLVFEIFCSTVIAHLGCPGNLSG